MRQKIIRRASAYSESTKKNIENIYKLMAYKEQKKKQNIKVRKEARANENRGK